MMKKRNIKTIAAFVLCALAAASAYADKNDDALITAAEKNDIATIRHIDTQKTHSKRGGT
ncbi:MAG: hypothetical protein K2N31_10935 [Treponemataceae bacterium]|nr:hypothetical protein [Treponemataceae bacterium]